MKKAFKTVLVLALAVLCLTAVAAAADAPASGICDVTVESGFSGSVTWKAQKADGTAVTTPTTQGEGTAQHQVYADAVKLELTYTGADSAAQYLVLALDDETKVPTETNVSFVDQDGGKTSVVYTIYPSALENGKTYNVYLSSNSSTDTNVSAMTKVASFSYYAAYKLGDVDEDGEITATDARYALALSVGNATTPKGQPWSANQRLAAEVDGDATGVTATDARYIMEAAVGGRDL